ncbi:hypothetical protein RRF57_008953 [Xylaria bambusicola]|uniref:Uncharacterized protein n=1 Tax=Xylaria bambusicola TaxID=326684 RepID=A0AAN7UIR4_9PEZI
MNGVTTAGTDVQGESSEGTISHAVAAASKRAEVLSAEEVRLGEGASMLGLVKPEEGSVESTLFAQYLFE